MQISTSSGPVPKGTGPGCFGVAGIVVVVSFCVAGLHIAEIDYQAYFSWSLFSLGYILAVGLFINCFSKST